MSPSSAATHDLRDSIFAAIHDKRFRAMVTAEGRGILAGCRYARQEAEGLGVELEFHLTDGAPLMPGGRVLTVVGPPKALALAEERLLGCLCKASGIATASRRAAELAAGKIRVVCGAWKKADPMAKGKVRMAIAAGGLESRLTPGPFVYLDKNYVRMLGGVAEALEATRDLEGVRVIQLKGETAAIAEEARTACRCGVGIVMVDTGRLADAEAVVRIVQDGYLGVQVAFAKGLKLSDIPELIGRGIDILDIGTAIVDAPLIDMRFDVVGEVPRGV